MKLCSSSMKQIHSASKRTTGNGFPLRFRLPSAATNGGDRQKKSIIFFSRVAAGAAVRTLADDRRKSTTTGLQCVNLLMKKMPNGSLSRGTCLGCASEDSNSTLGFTNRDAAAISLWGRHDSLSVIRTSDNGRRKPIFHPPKCTDDIHKNTTLKPGEAVIRDCILGPSSSSFFPSSFFPSSFFPKDDTFRGSVTTRYCVIDGGMLHGYAYCSSASTTATSWNGSSSFDVLHYASANRDGQTLVESVNRSFGMEYLLRERLPPDVYIGMQVLEASGSGEEFGIAADEVLKSLQLFSGNTDPYEGVSSSLLALDGQLSYTIASLFDEVTEVSEYLFKSRSKRFRPTVNLLVNQLLNDCFEPDLAEASGRCCDRHSTQLPANGIYRNEEEAAETRTLLQRKMIEITEMIHTASMLHDDVLDGAETRRGRLAAHRKFSNKKAILGGDFLLARACRVSAALSSAEAFERTANIVESLIKGELIQNRQEQSSLESMFRTYLTKTYYKTASLIAESCACGALLGGYGEEAKHIAFNFGMLVGMAFQLYDDLLDFTASSSALGKPAMIDFSSGVVTAPAFLSLLDYPDEMEKIIFKKSKSDEDLKTALFWIHRGSAVPRTRLAVMLYAQRALELLKELLSQRNNEALLLLRSRRRAGYSSNPDVSSTAKSVCSKNRSHADACSIAATFTNGDSIDGNSRPALRYEDLLSADGGQFVRYAQPPPAPSPSPSSPSPSCLSNLRQMPECSPNSSGEYNVHSASFSPSASQPKAEECQAKASHGAKQGCSSKSTPFSSPSSPVGSVLSARALAGLLAQTLCRKAG